MAIDKFAGISSNPSFPSTSVAEVTPDDESDLAAITLAINVATPGSVKITAQDGTVARISISPGAPFPIRARRIWATGTTATGITALY